MSYKGEPGERAPKEPDCACDSKQGSCPVGHPGDREKRLGPGPCPVGHPGDPGEPEQPGHIGDPGPSWMEVFLKAPTSDPYKSYQDMGGKLSQPEFWEFLSQIRRCREILCGIPQADAGKGDSLRDIWLSIYEEIHLGLNLPEERNAKRSSCLAETQTKGEVFWQLVSLVHGSFCCSSEAENLLETIAKRHFCRSRGLSQGDCGDKC